MEPSSLTVSAVAAAPAAKVGDCAIKATVQGGDGVLRQVGGRLPPAYADGFLDRGQVLVVAPDLHEVHREAEIKTAQRDNTAVTLYGASRDGANVVAANNELAESTCRVPRTMSSTDRPACFVYRVA